MRKYSGYDDYWDAYLKAHSKPATRLCHYMATVTGAGLGIVALITRNWVYLLIGILLGYVIATASHVMIQKNRPLIHRPLWGAISVLRMLGLALSGRLQDELRRHDVETGAPSSEVSEVRVGYDE